MRALVVDDDMVSRKKLAKIIQNMAECDTVSSGEAAIEAFKKAWEDLYPYDLICLDVIMPEMDGPEVLQNIRRLEQEMGIGTKARVKIMMVTAMSDTNMVSISLQAGCDDYMVKPFDIITVKDKLDHLFDHDEDHFDF